HLVPGLAEGNAGRAIEDVRGHLLAAVRGKVMHEHLLGPVQPQVTAYLERREYLAPVRVPLGAARRPPLRRVYDVHRRRQVLHAMTLRYHGVVPPRLRR